MKHPKYLLLSLILAGLSLAFMIVPYTTGCKSDKHSDSTNSVNVIINDSFKARPLTSIKFEQTAKRLQRGQYLAEGILQCFTCHSPRNWEVPGAPPITEKQGSSETIIQEDSTIRIIAPNITPDAETGAGTWSDDMLARAIREGVGHDGRALSRQMPYFLYKNLSDEDLAAVIVYLRSLPPIYNIVPPTKISAEERSGIEKSLKPIVQPVLSPDLSDTKERGRYLVSIADCSGCHMSGTLYHPGAFAGGGLVKRFGRKAFSANITSHPSGMAYGPEGFIFVMRTGKGGTLNSLMPWAAFQNMTDDDLKAIYTYLRTIPPSQHYVNNQMPFTRCVICGQEHGLGEQNKLEKPAGIKLKPDVYDRYAGHYQNEEFNFTLIIVRKGNRLLGKAGEDGLEVELIPQSEIHFLAPGWYLPISFVKDKNGHVTHLVEDSDEGLMFKKIKS
jgi:mono/diheme cytochrome c family protein